MPPSVSSVSWCKHRSALLQLLQLVIVGAHISTPHLSLRSSAPRLKNLTLSVHFVTEDGGSEE